MNTTLPIYDNRALKAWANARELQNSYEEITRALRHGAKYILLTGKRRNGKSSLLHTVAKEIPTSHHLIFLKGKDFPLSNNVINSDAHSSLSEDERLHANDFNSFVEFTTESIKFNEKLVILIDDADHLPIENLSKLLEINSNALSENHTIQFFMTGLPQFEKKLRAIDHLATQDLIHSSIDKLNKETINAISATKKYSIQSNTRNLEIDQNAPEISTNYVITRFQALQVLLESFLMLAKQRALSKISKNAVINAIDFVHHNFNHKRIKLIDFNLCLQQLSKHINIYNSNIKLSINKLSNNFSSISKKYIGRIPNIPANISKIYNLIIDLSSKISAKAVIKFEDEIKPTPRKYTTVKSLPGWDVNTAVILFVISLVLIISYRMQPGSLEHESSAEALLANYDLSTAFLDNLYLGYLNKSIGFKDETNILDATIDSIVKNSINNTSAKLKISTNEAVKTTAHKSSSPSNQESELNKLLDLAAHQFEAKQLTTPAGDNAYETYQYILFVNPSNEAALKGIKKVHNRYVSWANYSLQNNNGAKAKYLFNKALEIEPDNQSTLHALEDLKNAEDRLAGGANPLLLTASDSTDVQEILYKANKKMHKIEAGLVSNERDYKIYLDAQQTYETILKEYPNTEAAKAGLLKIKNYYLDWAELEFENKNYNTSVFLYEQARYLQPNDTNIKLRIDKIRMMSYKDN